MLRRLLWIGALTATFGSPLAGVTPSADPKSEDYNLPEATRQKPATSGDVPEPPTCLAADEFARLIDTTALAPVAILTADRDIPLWRRDTIPAILRPELDPAWHPTLNLTAQPGEFRVFQIGLLPTRSEIDGYDLTFSNLAGETGAIAAERCRCLSLHGTGPDGRPFHHPIKVAARTVQPLWIGIDIPADAKGIYRGEVKVVGAGTTPIPVQLTIEVRGTAVPEGGATDAWRLARLRWLDSTIGSEPQVPHGFSPVHIEDELVVYPGHRLAIGPEGLPTRIESTFSGSNTRANATPQPLLARPMRFVAETETGPLSWHTTAPAHPTIESDCAATWSASAASEGLTLSVRGRIGFDGVGRFALRVTATSDIVVRDLRLEIPYAESAARYFMGLNSAGGARPPEVSWKWDVASKHQDGFWLGAVNNGATWRFHDANYRSALVNIYYPFRPLLDPKSWSNGGAGGIVIPASAAGEVAVRVFSGPRHLRQGESLDFDFDVALTPSKPVDTNSQWRDRIVHPSETKGSDAIEAALQDLPHSSANLITIHHRKDQNPFINYPYGDAAFPLLRDFVRRAHERNARVKVYYTTREITQQLPEIWALDSLGGEIICPGPGPDARTVVNKAGPEPWLSAHLLPEFIPAWRATLSGRFAGARDLAVITTPDSRWHNFYLEGLDYLCRHAEIDGLYLDDTALDHDTLLRARRILERNRSNPHIDLHSWNHFKPLGAFANSALLYTELMPFLDRLWLGESFDYNKPPDFWLIEAAGIPYGVMSDMLQGGGQPWRGMLFGMTQQLGWNRGDPRPLWHYWDQFGMENTEMIGWWDDACPVHTDRPNIMATVYRKSDRALVALASWSEHDEPVRLRIDWAALGLDPQKTQARLVAIEGFQPGGPVSLESGIVVPAQQGRLIELISN